GKHWALVGYMGVLVGFLILSFYSVVGGWTIAYIAKSIGGEIISSDAKVLGTIFGNFISSPTEPLFYHAAFMALTVGVVLGGVQKGIENLSKFLMPALFVMMLVLIVRGLFLPGALDGVAYFLTPDFSKVGAKTVIDALGLAFFSLSLGMGAMITYGSYVEKDTSIPGSAVWVVLLTTAVCLLAGLMVLPAVFAFGFDPSAGPGLTFITMPAVFAKMVGGQLFAVVFFVLLLVAALTSAVSLMEVVTSFMIDEFHMKRVPAAIMMASLMFALGVPASLSLGVWSEYTLFGKGVFDLLDYATSNVLMPLNGVLLSLLVGWKIWPQIEAQLAANTPSSALWLPAMKMTCRYIAPALVGFVLINGL
ncbi:sodium-dependent transporter, partial [Craterilacuibacter sp.]|uniref:sodium-dependent transporter n=1 Tax=Craterilacuibacter sp. TaxID=2870909 RepID=UPI003F34226E